MLLGAELLLHVHRGGGHRHVAGDRADDDHVEIGGGEPGGFERRLAAAGRHVARDLAVGGDATLANARALGDPRVGRVDHPFEVGVGQHLGGRVVPGAEDRARRASVSAHGELAV